MNNQHLEWENAKRQCLLGNIKAIKEEVDSCVASLKKGTVKKNDLSFACSKLYCHLDSIAKVATEKSFKDIRSSASLLYLAKTAIRKESISRTDDVLTRLTSVSTKLDHFLYPKSIA